MRRRLARRVFFDESAEEADATPPWSAPILKPHLSLVYGGSPAALADLALPQSFVADAIAIWDCTPATLDAVHTWREVARVKLARAPPSAPAPLPLNLRPATW